MSVIPCHRGGHLCNWPVCPEDCDGRPGADAYSTALDRWEAENERLRAALTKIADLRYSEADEPLDEAINIADAAINGLIWSMERREAIERLRDQRDKLLAALSWIEDQDPQIVDAAREKFNLVAIAAVEGK